MKYIMGNWKMNMLPNEAIKYMEVLDNKLKTIKDISKYSNITLFVPYINIFYANLMSQETDVLVGAQNMYFESSGAYTGEISAEMLKSVNVYSVLIGHSERRQGFKETNEDINKKLIKSQEEGMQAVFCIGETLEEKEMGKTEEVLNEQIKKAFSNVNVNNIIIAYEPIWAIGTGKVCDIDTIKYIVDKIKKMVKEKYNVELPVIYGGSVKVENANEILKEENIDGLLVGGASLDPNNFFEIIKSTMMVKND